MGNRFDWGIYTGISPNYDYKDKDVNVRNHILYMLNRSLIMFRYDGLPDTIKAEDLERMLQTGGFAYITEVDGELYALSGGLGGEQDANGNPTKINISNPYLKFSKTLDIKDDGVLIKNDYMMLGLLPMFSRYGTLLNESEITMILATVNKRVDNLISVSDDNTAESARVYLKKIFDGELGYIFENKLYDSLKYNPNSNSKSVHLSDLVEFTQYIKASLYNEIGLNANHNMKKERMITKELEINSNSIFPLVDNMLENRVNAIEKINKKYDLDITVELNSSWGGRNNPLDDETPEPIGKVGEGGESSPQDTTDPETVDEMIDETKEETDPETSDETETETDDETKDETGDKE